MQVATGGGHQAAAADAASATSGDVAARAGLGLAREFVQAAEAGSQSSSQTVDGFSLSFSGQDGPDEVEGVEAGEEEENDPSDWARLAELCLRLPPTVVGRPGACDRGVDASGSRRAASARAPPVIGVV